MGIRRIDPLEVAQKAYLDLYNQNKLAKQKKEDKEDKDVTKKVNDKKNFEAYFEEAKKRIREEEKRYATTNDYYEKNKKNDNERGSVTAIVVESVLFLMIVLSTIFTTMALKNKSQLAELSELNHAYDGNMEAIYNERKEDSYTFDYTGSEQTFNAKKDGYYLLEVWGASGGNITSYRGGYGGYSTGVVKLNENDNLYINVGGKGTGATTIGEALEGGYNGGGSVQGSSFINNITASGGGATHIATRSGLLYDLLESKDSVLIVSGGGGGAIDQANHEEASRWGNGGSGGGFNSGAIESSNGTLNLSLIYDNVSTQNSGYLFGKGEDSKTSENGTGANSGGGAGWFGGYSGEKHSSGFYYGVGQGGSGYIGNSLLISYGKYIKHMAGYNVTSTNDKSTKTISVTKYSDVATTDYAKSGNGYVKITYIGN